MAQENLNILFWNARSISKRKEELPKILSTIDIFVCVESWLQTDDTQKNEFRIPGFNSYQKNRADRLGGGILFLMRKNLDITALDDIETPSINTEMAGIKINNVTPQLNIIACYRSPGETLTEEEWYLIVDNVKNRGNTILMGDFNAHHDRWNCSSSDQNGKRLYKAIDKKDIYS